MKITAEIFVAMNEAGEFEVGTTEDEASERLTDTYGGCRSRIVMIAAKMTPPHISEVQVDVTDETEQEIEAAA